MYSIIALGISLVFMAISIGIMTKGAVSKWQKRKR